MYGQPGLVEECSFAGANIWDCYPSRSVPSQHHMRMSASHALTRNARSRECCVYSVQKDDVPSVRVELWSVVCAHVC